MRSLKVKGAIDRLEDGMWTLIAFGIYWNDGPTIFFSVLRWTFAVEARVQ